MTEMAVLVSDRGRLADTVSYALREGRDVAQERTTVVRFLVPVGAGPDALPLPAARALLERVRAVVASEPLGRLAVETDAVRISGADASARTGALVDRLPEGVRRVVLMPELVEFDPVRLPGEGEVEAITGYSRQELVGNAGMAFADLIHPEDRDQVWRQIQTIS